MDKMPKRRKYKDNPYELMKDSKNDIYLIKIKSFNNSFQIVEVSKEVYKVFDEYELKDISQMNEYDNHIEHFNLSENLLHKKIKYKIKGLDEIVEEKIINEELMKAIANLPEIQRKRIKLYFFDDLTYQQIANLEGCTKRAIKFSVDIAIANLYKKMSNKI